VFEGVDVLCSSGDGLRGAVVGHERQRIRQLERAGAVTLGSGRHEECKTLLKKEGSGRREKMGSLFEGSRGAQKEVVHPANGGECA